MLTGIRKQIADIIKSAMILKTDELPSDWIERVRYMPPENPFKGKFSYKTTPYMKEIVNFYHPSFPAKIGGLKKGGQAGASAGVIQSGIANIISERPGNILFMVGHENLIDKAMEKVDKTIDGCNIRHLIRPATQRKSKKTGDTSKEKTYAGGNMIIMSATNHKQIRQMDAQYGFYDDYEAVPNASKESGSTEKMLMQRHAAFYSKMKVLFISTPELKMHSNIDDIYNKGDQRHYMIHCDSCHEPIDLQWSVEIDGTEGKEKAGFVWKLDNQGRVISSSVGYVCQLCSGFFTDKNKHQFLNEGFWKPTAEPFNEDYVSWWLPSLYAPAGMFDWKYYVNQWVEANPPGQPANEGKLQTFYNLALALSYEPKAVELTSSQIQKNTRSYEIGTVPEHLSMADGNGRIVLITCAADMNGVPDDARLDYEITAWSETGSKYSIAHGSIGTFVPRENSLKVKQDRARWTYEENKPNSVWPEFDNVLKREFEVISKDKPRRMPISIAGLDSGHYTKNYAYPYIDKANKKGLNVVGLKGDNEQYLKETISRSKASESAERVDLYILQVGLLKDEVAHCMKLSWEEGEAEQPTGFMNYPMPANGLYTYNTYFSHFEAEHRTTVSIKNGTTAAFMWVKRSSNLQNHFFDCAVYNLALRDIWILWYRKLSKNNKLTWTDFASAMVSIIEESI